LVDDDPDRLNALGRAARDERKHDLAIALQRSALRLAPAHAQARADLEIARTAIVSESAAQAHYAAALALEPDIACHHRSVGANERFVGMDAVGAALDAAIAAHPSHAPAHAARANLAARRGDRDGATRD
jgi:tetratricopeptide (TPR) repeat protein